MGTDQNSLNKIIRETEKQATTKKILHLWLLLNTTLMAAAIATPQDATDRNHAARIFSALSIISLACVAREFARTTRSLFAKQQVMRHESANPDIAKQQQYPRARFSITGPGAMFWQKNRTLPAGAGALDHSKANIKPQSDAPGQYRK